MALQVERKKALSLKKTWFKDQLSALPPTVGHPCPGLAVPPQASPDPQRTRGRHEASDCPEGGHLQAIRKVRPREAKNSDVRGSWEKQPQRAFEAASPLRDPLSFSSSCLCQVPALVRVRHHP